MTLILGAKRKGRNGFPCLRVIVQETDNNGCDFSCKKTQLQLQRMGAMQWGWVQCNGGYRSTGGRLTARWQNYCTLLNYEYKNSHKHM